MASDAARLEALGEPEVRFCWRGHDLTIPLALEEWPLDLIRATRYVDAIESLLAGQTAPIPRYGDAVDLADAMAAAVGVERLPETKPSPDRKFGEQIFGGIPLLLALLDGFEDDIACDLKTFRNVDYADRWRGGLTLRQIWVYIRRLPLDSALSIATNGGHERWTKQAIVTAQVWEMLARRVYVGRPMTREEIDAALAAKAKADAQMSDMKAKQDYWSPEASRARMDAARAAKAQIAAGGSPRNTPEPPPTALSAMDKAMAARRRDLTTSRKAG